MGVRGSGLWARLRVMGFLVYAVPGGCNRRQDVVPVVLTTLGHSLAGRSDGCFRHNSASLSDLG